METVSSNHFKQPRPFRLQSLNVAGTTQSSQNTIWVGQSTTNDVRLSKGGLSTKDLHKFDQSRTAMTRSPRQNEHARESFYESTISKLVQNKMHKPDGPLASTIGVIRANIDTKSAVDCEVLLKQVGFPESWRTADLLTGIFSIAGSAVPGPEPEIDERATRWPSLAVHRDTPSMRSRRPNNPLIKAGWQRPPFQLNVE